MNNVAETISNIFKISDMSTSIFMSCWNEISCITPLCVAKIEQFSVPVWVFCRYCEIGLTGLAKVEGNVCNGDAYIELYEFTTVLRTFARKSCLRMCFFLTNGKQENKTIARNKKYAVFCSTSSEMLSREHIMLFGTI